MTIFVDQYLPDCINSYGAVSSPHFSTDIPSVDSGAETPNQRWVNPLHQFNIPQGVRDMETLNALRVHWMIMRGPFKTWPFRDPLDHASVDVLLPGNAPTISALDMLIGTGDGFTTNFQVIKNYTVGSETYARPVTLPVTTGFLVAVNGTPTVSGWTISRTTGVLTFDVAPINGQSIKVGYLFDVPVRFAGDDSFDAIASSYQAGGFADIPLSEVRIC